MVLTFHPPVLPLRSTLVAAIAAALGLLALANLSPAPHASVGHAPSFQAPIAGPVARGPLALARADSVSR